MAALIENTYKTILFDEFDRSSKLRLDIMLEDETVRPNNNSMIPEVDKLTVHSFSEFVDKFVPSIYANQHIVTSDEGKRFIIEYDFKENGTTPIKLTEHPYFKTLEKIYAAKKSSGQSNLDFDDDSILKSILPEEVAREVEKTRKLLEVYAEKYYEADRNGRSTEKFKEAYDAQFKKVQEQEESTDVCGLLPLIIADEKAKIKFLTGSNNGNLSSVVENQAKVCRLAYDGKGRLIEKKIEALPAPNVSEGNDVNIKQLIYDDINNDYTDLIEERNANRTPEQVEENKDGEEYVRQLMLSAYAPMVNIEVNESLTDLKVSLAEHENAYVSYIQGFADKMAPIIEKVLAVKIYFDHATIKGEFPRSRGLVVANCRPQDLLDGDNIQNKFEKFIKYFGITQNGNNKLWLAIIPNVSDGVAIANNTVKKDDSGLAGRHRRKKNSANKVSSDDTRMSEVNLKPFLDIMEKGRILTIFSYKGNAENHLAAIGDDYIRGRKEALRFINSEYASYAYPNFNIMNLRTITVSQEDNIIFDGEEVHMEAKTVTLPAIYIDACYVAAGLIAASQQQDYLTRVAGINSFYIESSLPCVHVDLEKDAIRHKMLTRFNPEVEGAFDPDTHTEMKEFGFVFSSDTVIDDNDKEMQNTIVRYARTLCLDNNVHVPIYSALTKNYINEIIKLKQWDTPAKIKKDFIGREYDKWKKAKFAVEAKEECVNLLLWSSDEIIWNEEKKKLSVKFGDIGTTLDLYNIVQ